MATLLTIKGQYGYVEIFGLQDEAIFLARPALVQKRRRIGFVALPMRVR